MEPGRRGVLSDPEELRALLLLRLLPGVGDRRSAMLLDRFGTAVEALRAPGRLFRPLAGAEGERARRDAALRRRVDEILRTCGRSGITVMPRGAPGYPRRLGQLADPPPVLFLRGDPALLLLPSVTMVGARRATATGRRTAERLAREISERDVPVVSGLALGIDAAAHRGALRGPGGTVAVLGSGPDRPHPRGNRPLFRRIVAEGLVVSEFPPGEPARPHHFPRRNRILAALAHTVVVVEAGARSGALITVDHALDLGREVYAVPGSVDSPLSRGTNRLLGDGAGAVVSAADLAPALRWGWRQWAEEPGPLERRARRPRPTARAGRDGVGGALRTDLADPVTDPVLACLEAAPAPADVLAVRTGLAPGELLARLTELELEGRVRRDGDGWCRGGR